MLLFVTGDFFRGWRARRDGLPFRPMLDFVAFWALLGIGAFCAAAAAFMVIAAAELDFHFDVATGAIAVALAGSAIVLINRAFVFWWRLRGSTTRKNER